MAKNVRKVKYPVWLETTPCTIVLEIKGVSEDGEPLTAKTVNTKCIYSEHAKRVIDKDGRAVNLTGTVYKQGDVAPELSEIAGGRVRINGGEYEIFAASRLRNPDGTIHHTELNLV